MTTLTRRPFLPNDDDALHFERRSWQRAITAHALAALHLDDPTKILKANWPSDERARLITRAAVSPTTTASLPPFDAIATFRSLAPGSGALRLLDSSLKLNLSGLSTWKIPNIAALPPAPIFVGEGAPAPVVQFAFRSTILGPMKKVLVMSGVTNELQNASAETAVATIGRVLADATVKSFDTIAFSTGAATAVQPAGLLHDATVVTTAAPAGAGALKADLANLVDAISDAGIATDGAIFVAPAREALLIKAEPVGPKFNYEVFETLGLPPRTVAAFAPDAVASGYQDAPTIEASTDALLHYDSVPSDISTAGTPAVAAFPTRSAFQTNIVNIRVRMLAAWACVPGGSAYVTNVNW